MPHVGVFESDNPSSDNLRGLVRSGPSSMPHSGVVDDNPRSDNPCGETKFTRKGNAAQTSRRVGQPSLRLLSFPPDMQNDSLQVGDSGGPQVLCEDIDTSRSEILQISAEQVCLAVQAQSGQATEDPEEPRRSSTLSDLRVLFVKLLRTWGLKAGWNKVASIAKSMPFSAGRLVHMQ